MDDSDMKTSYDYSQHLTTAMPYRNDEMVKFTNPLLESESADFEPLTVEPFDLE